MFETTITTADLWSGVTQDVGGHRHVRLIDIISAIQSPEDEQLLLLLHGGCPEEEIAEVMGVHQSTIARRFERLLKTRSRG